MERKTYKDEMGFHLKAKYENVDIVELLGEYEEREEHDILTLTMSHEAVLRNLKKIIQVGVPIVKICHTLEILQTIGFITIAEYAEIYNEIVNNI